jgi:hypothetical protein
VSLLTSCYYSDDTIQAVRDAEEVVDGPPKVRVRVSTVIIRPKFDDFIKPTLNFWTWFIIALQRCNFQPILGRIYGHRKR